MIVVMIPGAPTALTIHERIAATMAMTATWMMMSSSWLPVRISTSYPLKRFFLHRLLAIVLVSGAASGCGSGAGPSEREADRPESEPVRVAVDLERETPGAPDGGTRTGHGAGAVAVTGHEAFGFTGRVAPADSDVRVALADGGRAGPVVVEPSGRFSAAIGGLRPGVNLVRLTVAKPGLEPWREDIRVVRRPSPPEVRVPERDTAPPVALLRLGPAERGPSVLSVSPSAPGDRPETVRLRRPMFHATALVRDTGGAGRIRLSTTYETRCGDRVRPTHRSLPPAQIVNVKLAPGVMVVSEEVRTATMRLRAGPGCTVTGEAWAEATDGHGLQAVSRHVAFRYP